MSKYLAYTWQKVYAISGVPDDILKKCWQHGKHCRTSLIWVLFVCVEVLQPSQPNGVMSSAVSLPNHTFTVQA